MEPQASCSADADTARCAAARIEAGTRDEAIAASERLSAIADLVVTRTREQGGDIRDRWWCDRWSTACAEVAAASTMTTKQANREMHIALALRFRLPQLAELFAQGKVSYRLVAMITWRAGLVTDSDIVTALDAAIAAEVLDWGTLSGAAAATEVDRLIEHHDPDAVRRSQSRARGSGVHLGKSDDVTGTASLWGSLLAEDAALFDTRLDSMITAVCERDGRTYQQLRAAAVGALSAGTELACRCGDPDCAAASRYASSMAGKAVIYVVAEEAALNTPTDPLMSGPDPESPDEADAVDNGDVPPWESAAPPEGDDWVDEAEVETGRDSEPEQHSEVASKPETKRPRESELGPEIEDDSGARVPERRLSSSKITASDPDSRPNPPAHSSGSAHDSVPSRTTKGRRPLALIIGGGLLTPAQVGDLVRAGAQVRYLKPTCEFVDAEPRYRPSAALAAHVRARDLHCTFPNCSVPATHCDIDHTTPWPHGPTHASNLKCLCRFHHLLKTFWDGENGWRDLQRSDGTIVWTSPSGRCYTTQPGCRRFFPSLTVDTVPAPMGKPHRPSPHRGVMMPTRRMTRAQQQQQDIEAERAVNRRLREAEAAARAPAQAEAEASGNAETDTGAAE